jgi:hypothetical protein
LDTYTKKYHQPLHKTGAILKYHKFKLSEHPKILGWHPKYMALPLIKTLFTDNNDDRISTSAVLTLRAPTLSA